MRRVFAAGLMLVAASAAAAGIPPMVPLLPPGFIEQLPQPEPALTDPAKLAERIAANTKAAATRLADRDPGADARKAQQQALRDIDELLKLAENQPPPPMPMSGDGAGNPPMPPPSGGGESGGQPPPSGGQPPPGGGSSGMSKGAPPPGGKPSPGKGGSPQPSGAPPGPTAVPATPGSDQPAGPMKGGQEPGKPGGPNTGGTDPGDGPAGGGPLVSGKQGAPVDDRIAKQVWGHLPDTVRKQMSQYYQEQFMPRYGGLLRDYYSALAEREKQPPSGVIPKR